MIPTWRLYTYGCNKKTKNTKRNAKGGIVLSKIYGIPPYACLSLVWPFSDFDEWVLT